MKEYTKDITVIVSNMNVYRRQEQAIHVYPKRSNAENVVKYRANKNNATYYIHIIKEYTRDITIIVSNTVTNIGVKSRLYILMNWAAFSGFSKKIN